MDPNSTDISNYENWPFVNARTCFYMLMPHETYFKTADDIPPLTARAIPPGTIFLLIELIILFTTGRSHEWRLHSAVVSWTSTAMYEGFSFFLFRGIELTFYQWTYEHFRLVTLEWNALTTYLFAMLTVEFCGYWWHRMSHELAIMWASHELHHSSDDFNLSVAFRNSAPMRFFRWTFYIPLAFLGVPTAIMATHLTLGSIYNGFIHQHAVPKLGKVIPVVGDFLEFVFVTPSHHRVHHGSNPYCIDKNYGQYMIVWDRLFGTFAEERENEPLVYGTLTQPNTYDMAKLQVSSFAKLWEKVQSMTTFSDKLRAVFYGPGWFPGTPRLGNYDEIPDVRGRKKYNPSYPTWISTYLVVNSCCIFYAYLNMAARVKFVPNSLLLTNLTYIFFGYSAVGSLYDKKRRGPGLELARIILFLGLTHFTSMLTHTATTTYVIYIHYANLLLWPFVANYIYSLSPEDIDTNIDYNDIKINEPSKPLKNGSAKGHSNGSAKGHTNGSTKGHSNGSTKGHSNGSVNGRVATNKTKTN